MPPIRDQDNSSESWLSYRREVVSFMQRIEEQLGKAEDRINAMAGIEKMQEDVDRIEAKVDKLTTSVISLKAKAGAWGAMAALLAVPTFEFLLKWLFGKRFP